MLPNIDELLLQLKQDYNHIEERQKERQEQYKKSTQLYLKSVKNEITTLDKTEKAHTTRNKEFRKQISDLYARYIVNSYNIVKTQKRSVGEKIELNNYLSLAYPDYASKKIQTLEKQNDSLQKRLETLRELNRKENVNLYEIMNQKYEGFEYLDQIKAKRQQLEREVVDTKKLMRGRSNTQGPETENLDKQYQRDFKDIYGSEVFEQGSSKRLHTQSESQKYNALDEFLLPQPVDNKHDIQIQMDNQPQEIFGKDYNFKNYNNNPVNQQNPGDVNNLRFYVPNNYQNNVNNQRQQTQLLKNNLLDQFMINAPQPLIQNNYPLKQQPIISDTKRTPLHMHSNSLGNRQSQQQLQGTMGPQQKQQDYQIFKDSRENSPQDDTNNLGWKEDNKNNDSAFKGLNSKRIPAQPSQAGNSQDLLSKFSFGVKPRFESSNLPLQIRNKVE